MGDGRGVYIQSKKWAWEVDFSKNSNSTKQTCSAVIKYILQIDKYVEFSDMTSVRL